VIELGAQRLFNSRLSRRARLDSVLAVIRAAKNSTLLLLF